MDSFEYRGKWWTPENPDKVIFGSLIYSPKSGVKLKLFGAMNRTVNRSPEFCPIILGIIENGKFVTLQNCQRSSYSLNNLIIETSDYIASSAFFGFHVDSKQDLKFVKVRAKFTYLFDWVGVSGISHEYSNKEEKHKFSVNYITPEDILVSTGKGKIRFASEVNFDSKRSISSLKENPFIQIECNEEFNLFEIFNNFLSPIHDLINLGTDKSNSVEELILFHKDNPGEEIIVFYTQNFYQSKVKDLFPHDMIFTLSDSCG